MSAIFRVGRTVNRLLFRSPAVRKKSRTLGMALLTFAPYVEHKRKDLLERDTRLTEQDRALIGRIDCRISRSDTMFEGDVATYLLVGLSGLRAIEGVLQSRPGLVIRSILDLPCGCGRVGRYLAASFPKATVTACDLMTEGVDFCAQKFGFVPFYSKPDFKTLNLNQKYDLIWCGSLVTHLNPRDIQVLLRFFEQHLSDTGVLVFTAHGDRVAQRLEAGTDYGITSEDAAEALAAYRSKGFAFKPYIGNRETDQYGFSMTSREWLRSQLNNLEQLREVSFQAQGWDDHQDVYGYAKLAR